MKKSGSHAFVNQVLAVSLAAACGGGGIGLGTVWMRHQISVAANANKAIEMRIAEVERRIEETGADIAREQDPEALSRRNTAWNLGLVPPGDTQVHSVIEDPVVRLARMRNSELFGEEGAVVRLNLPGAR